MPTPGANTIMTVWKKIIEKVTDTTETTVNIKPNQRNGWIFAPRGARARRGWLR